MNERNVGILELALRNIASDYINRFGKRTIDEPLLWRAVALELDSQGVWAEGGVCTGRVQMGEMDMRCERHMGHEGPHRILQTACHPEPRTYAPIQPHQGGRADSAPQP